MFVNANEFIVFGIGSPLVEWVKGSVAKSAVSLQNLATLSDHNNVIFSP